MIHWKILAICGTRLCHTFQEKVYHLQYCMYSRPCSYTIKLECASCSSITRMLLLYNFTDIVAVEHKLGPSSDCFLLIGRLEHCGLGGFGTLKRVGMAFHLSLFFCWFVNWSSVKCSAHKRQLLDRYTGVRFIRSARLVFYTHCKDLQE